MLMHHKTDLNCTAKPHPFATPPDREELVNSFSGIKTLPCSSDNTPYQINQYMKLSNRVSGLIWTIILVKISSRLVAAPSLDIRATQAATAYLHLWQQILTFLLLNINLGAQMGITHSTLPRNNGNLPLPFFGGNYTIVPLDNVCS